MPRELKVFGGIMRLEGRQVRAVVAATSIAAAARAASLPDSYVRGFWSVTGHPAELDACLAAPGEVFFSEIHSYEERKCKPFPKDKLGYR